MFSFPRDQSRIRKCAERYILQSLRKPPLSPLLYGPFLISPGRDQNATPRISTPKQPCHDIKSQTHKNRSALAPELPQAPPRGEVPPRLPLTQESKLPAGLPASRFRIFLLIEYPYTTLSSRAGRRLSTHAHLSEFLFLIPDAAIDRNPAPPQCRRSPASLTHIRVV